MWWCVVRFCVFLCVCLFICLCWGNSPVENPSGVTWPMCVWIIDVWVHRVCHVCNHGRQMIHSVIPYSYWTWNLNRTLFTFLNDDLGLELCWIFSSSAHSHISVSLWNPPTEVKCLSNEVEDCSAALISRSSDSISACLAVFCSWISWC